jgi:hypothetical protein
MLPVPVLEDTDTDTEDQCCGSETIFLDPDPDPTFLRVLDPDPA